MDCEKSLKLFIMKTGFFEQFIPNLSRKNCTLGEMKLNRWVGEKKVKLAGKPGSVVDSHSSRRFVT